MYLPSSWRATHQTGFTARFISITPKVGHLPQSQTSRPSLTSVASSRVRDPHSLWVRASEDWVGHPRDKTAHGRRKEIAYIPVSVPRTRKPTGLNIRLDQASMGRSSRHCDRSTTNAVIHILALHISSGRSPSNCGLMDPVSRSLLLKCATVAASDFARRSWSPLDDF